MMNKITIKMYRIGLKSNLFKPDDVSMLGHSFGVLQFPQFYDTIKNIKYEHDHTWEFMNVCCVLNQPLVRAVCLNHEVVVSQPRTLTATSLGSITYY